MTTDPTITTFVDELRAKVEADNYDGEDILDACELIDTLSTIAASKAVQVARLEEQITAMQSERVF